ncbi:MAG: response regulator [Prolixibacteraceae bacterium]|nr:response regulator [Prolixibacteraceae bacterium]
MGHFSFFLLLIALFTFQGVGARQQLFFEQLNIADGLSHSLISGCVEDQKGFMWFATQDGINRYDGYGFKVYQSGEGPRHPSSSWINSIYMDKKDQIWILFQGSGINRFDTHKDLFYNYKTDEETEGSISTNVIQPLNSSLFNMFYEDVNDQLWIGSQNGLNFYHRESDSFTVFQNKPGNHLSLIDNRIISLDGDQVGNIWIGTQRGLSKFEVKNQKFINFYKNELFKSNNDSVISIVKVLNDSTVIAGAPIGGAVIIELNKNTGTHTFTNILTKSTIINEEASILCIYQSTQGRILVGMIGGLYELSKHDDQWNSRLLSPTLGYKINKISEDQNGNIWASATLSRKLFRFDANLSNEENIPIISKSFSEIKDFFIKSLYISKTGLLWLGTEKDGVLKTNLNNKAFNLISNQHYYPPRIPNNEIYSIYEDRDNNIYVGSKAGLTIVRIDQKSYHHFEQAFENPKYVTASLAKQIPGNIVGAIEPWHDGRLWLGLFDYKVSLFNPDNKSFLNFHHNPNDDHSFKLWSLRTICVTRDNNVYFGGTSHGLIRYNAQQNNFYHYPVSESGGKGSSDSWINVIHEDREGILWLGTSLGILDSFDPQTETFTPYMLNRSYQNPNGDNIIKAILEPQIHGENILWLATHAGLIKFDKTTGNCETFNKTHGFRSNTLHGILEDKKGNLWISSNKGLIFFDPITLNVRNYTAEDGLQSDEFNECAYFKNERGIMYFGGINGISWFDPDQLNENPYDAKPVITGFSLFNNPVKACDTINNRVLLKTNISFVDNITLTHKDRIFSLEFSTLNYVSSKKNQFRYLLEGFEEVPNTVDATKRFASYTNLPTGEYTFKVWATNSDGKWSPEPAVLKITMLPPFWEKLWFKLSLVFAVLLLFFSILRLRISMLKKQQKHLQQQVEERTHDLKLVNQQLKEQQHVIIKSSEELALQRDNLKAQNELLELQKDEIASMAQKIHENDELKLRFFTNISHELRTPLTLIVGPTESLLNANQYTDTLKVKDKLNLIFKNGKRLFRLINQLLEIRRIETGSMKLKVREDDLVAFLFGITELFEGLARKNNINFSFITEFDVLKVYFDADKIEKVVFNLLSNAFNHTPLGGAITVFLDTIEQEGKPMVKVSVADTGKGILEKHLPHIFDRFYQISTKSETGQISSGIGLSLCRDLMEKHKGKIEAISEYGKGTSMEVFLPVCTDCYTDQEMSDETDNAAFLDYSRSMLDDAPGNGPVFQQSRTATIHSFKVLIVEDDPDMQKFMADDLADEYHVNVASNGAEGWKMIQAQMPDLILSDVMMPEMNGFELCRNVKENQLTSHIPFLMLTAKSSVESQIQGFEHGADDYITKPFNSQLLKLRIKNILDSRMLLAKKFTQEIDSIPANIKISEIDHNFLKRMIKIIEDNIDNTDFGGDKLAAELAISKGNLYKKLNALTGLTVNIFIRNLRLKNAAKLLKSGNYGISDIAYAVGFNNPKYFSTCFRDLFNMTPKEYMNS